MKAYEKSEQCIARAIVISAASFSILVALGCDRNGIDGESFYRVSSGVMGYAAADVLIECSGKV